MYGNAKQIPDLKLRGWIRGKVDKFSKTKKELNRLNYDLKKIQLEYKSAQNYKNNKIISFWANNFDLNYLSKSRRSLRNKIKQEREIKYGLSKYYLNMIIYYLIRINKMHYINIPLPIIQIIIFYFKTTYKTEWSKTYKSSTITINNNGLYVNGVGGIRCRDSLDLYSFDNQLQVWEFTFSGKNLYIPRDRSHMHSKNLFRWSFSWRYQNSFKQYLRPEIFMGVVSEKETFQMDLNTYTETDAYGDGRIRMMEISSGFGIIHHLKRFYRDQTNGWGESTLNSERCPCCQCEWDGKHFKLIEGINENDIVRFEFNSKNGEILILINDRKLYRNNYDKCTLKIPTNLLNKHKWYPAILSLRPNGIRCKLSFPLDSSQFG